MQNITINTIDIIIVVLYVSFIVWWGLHNGKSKDSQSYFLADRGMSWWVVGLSLFAASVSSTTLIGQSGDAYHTGLAVFNYNLAGGVLVMVFFAIVLLPLYIRSGIFTIPEFLEKRFDSRSRYFFSAISVIGNVFLDGAGALYAAALIIKLVYPEADLHLIIIIFALLCASYTIPGGLSSAINAEIIQAVILILGSVILSIACYYKGGDYFIQLFNDGDVLTRLIRPVDDAATPWLGLIIGMPITGLYFWANNQTLVQRVLSSKTVDEGRKGVLFAGFLTLCTLFIVAIPGVIARYLFPGLVKPDMVYPNMVLNLLPVGLLGILLAALLSALTSTLSAILNSTSTLITMDFYAKINKKADSRNLVVVGKVVSCIVIIIAALWAPQIGRFGSLLKYYQEMLSYLAPPIVATFLMGVFCKRVNANGGFAGLLGGLLIAILTYLFKDSIFHELHFLLMVPILFTVSAVVTYIASLFSAAPEKSKLGTTVFSFTVLRKEIAEAYKQPAYANYFNYAALLVFACGVVYAVFW